MTTQGTPKHELLLAGGLSSEVRLVTKMMVIVRSWWQEFRVGCKDTFDLNLAL